MKAKDVGILIIIGIVIAVSTRLIVGRLIPNEGERSSCGSISMILKENGFRFEENCIAVSVADAEKQLVVKGADIAERAAVLKNMVEETGWKTLPASNGKIIAVRPESKKAEFIVWNNGVLFFGEFSSSLVVITKSEDASQKELFYVDAKIHNMLDTLRKSK